MDDITSDSIDLSDLAHGVVENRAAHGKYPSEKAKSAAKRYIRTQLRPLNGNVSHEAFVDAAEQVCDEAEAKFGGKPL